MNGGSTPGDLHFFIFRYWWWCGSGKEGGEDSEDIAVGTAKGGDIGHFDRLRGITWSKAVEWVGGGSEAEFERLEVVIRRNNHILLLWGRQIQMPQIQVLKAVGSSLFSR